VFGSFFIKGLNAEPLLKFEALSKANSFSDLGVSEEASMTQVYRWFDGQAVCQFSDTAGMFVGAEFIEIDNRINLVSAFDNAAVSASKISFDIAAVGLDAGVGFDLAKLPAGLTSVSAA
jgi:hypothetical protein